MLPKKIKLLYKNRNNQDLIDKANYIEDEKYIKLYCRRKGISVEEFLGKDASDEDTSKNKDS